MVYTGKNRDCLPAITVRCLQLVGHFHPLVFCLIFIFFFLFKSFPFFAMCPDLFLCLSLDLQCPVWWQCRLRCDLLRITLHLSHWWKSTNNAAPRRALNTITPFLDTMTVLPLCRPEAHRPATRYKNTLINSNVHLQVCVLYTANKTVFSITGHTLLLYIMCLYGFHWGGMICSY